jgi:probable addiction module antidote protein
MAINDRAVTFSGFDAADYLRDEADIAAYLEAAVAQDDPAVLARALGAIVRARNMSELARDTGLTRQSLYKSLSGRGNPSLDTIMRVTNALGYQITFKKRRKPRVIARKSTAQRLAKVKAKASRR